MVGLAPKITTWPASHHTNVRLRGPARESAAAYGTPISVRWSVMLPAAGLRLVGVHHGLHAVAPIPMMPASVCTWVQAPPHREVHLPTWIPRRRQRAGVAHGAQPDQAGIRDPKLPRIHHGFPSMLPRTAAHRARRPALPAPCPAATCRRTGPATPRLQHRRCRLPPPAFPPPRPAHAAPRSR